MIKAVIFDFFGVLATRGIREFKQQYFQNDQVKIQQAKKVQSLVDRGQIGYDDFIDELAKIAGVDSGTILQYSENYQPNTDLLNYAQENLKPKYKLGIISNSGADWVSKIIGSQAKLFDDIVLSYQVGYIKPDSEIYELSAANLGVKPTECVFIDDILTYCQGAEIIGMNTVWYQNFKQMKSELESILAAGSNN